MRPTRRRALASCLIAALLALALAPATALAAVYVLDEAAVISPATEARIEALSARLEAATPSAEVAVVTVPSLGGRSIEEYAEQRFEQLGIGQKGKDNGVLLLVAPTERKVRIEVGYGLEGALPDAKAGAIIDEIIIPAFKAGNLDAGIEQGHAAIVGIVAEEYGASGLEPTVTAGSGAVPGASGEVPIGLIIGAIIAVVLIVAVISAVRRARGGGSSDAGPFIWPPTGGGSDSWGDSGGGSDFGGGDSGGGGASGDW